jgi:dihydropteroate synthase
MTECLRPGRPAAHPAGLPQPDRCVVMGVVNVTPDSFSDGGQWFELDDAIGHGLDLAAQGADMVDIGGESTRPGATRPSQNEELRRVLPVVRELARAGVTVSIDTMRARVAEAAIEAGASLVNDVSGGRADPDMLKVAGGSGLPIVLMHWRGHSADMQNRATYEDVTTTILEELRPQVDAAIAAGVAADRIIVDPGLGFAKTGEHNWTVLAQLDRMVAWGFPVLVAASRKRFIGTLLADPVTGAERPSDQRDAASAALSAMIAQSGVWCVRVHDVPPTLDAVRVAARWGAELANLARAVVGDVNEGG